MWLKPRSRRVVIPVFSASGHEQGATSLLESVKAHVNERLKSPFGGAFVIAWIAINWEKLFILILSEDSAEKRAAAFAEKMSNADGLWLPLAYAAIGLISYYAFSGIAIALFEAYGVLRRYVERKFDDYRWVPPDQYIEWKRGSIKAIKDIQEIASDKLEKIANLERAVADLDLQGNELREKIRSLELTEEELQSSLRRSQEDLLKARRNADEIRLNARKEFLEENGQLVDKLVGLSVDLEMRLAHFRLASKKGPLNDADEAVLGVLAAGTALTKAIDKQWGDEPL